MQRIGDDEAGFSVAFDAGSNTVHVDAWGFWPVAVAGAFSKTVLDTCRGSPGVKNVSMDMRQLKPLRDEGQDAVGRVLSALPSIGIQRTSVITGSHLTKLQLLRISKAHAAPGAVDLS